MKTIQKTEPRHKMNICGQHQLRVLNSITIKKMKNKNWREQTHVDELVDGLLWFRSTECAARFGGFVSWSCDGINLFGARRCAGSNRILSGLKFLGQVLWAKVCILCKIRFFVESINLQQSWHRRLIGSIIWCTFRRITSRLVQTLI